MFKRTLCGTTPQDHIYTPRQGATETAQFMDSPSKCICNRLCCGLDFRSARLHSTAFPGMVGGRSLVVNENELLE